MKNPDLKIRKTKDPEVQRRCQRDPGADLAGSPGSLSSSAAETVWQRSFLEHGMEQGISALAPWG